MSRIKYWDEASQSWRYADSPSGSGGTAAHQYPISAVTGLQDALDGKQPKNLVVIADGNTKLASHGSSEIYDYVQSGGDVVCQYGATILNYVEGGSGMVAFQQTVITADRVLGLILLIDNEKNVTFTENVYQPPTTETDASGVACTVIEEANGDVATTEGTVLSTKMTPAEALEAAKGGLQLKAWSDADEEWKVYTLSNIAGDGSALYFQYTNSRGWIDGIDVSVADDGTMTADTITRFSIDTYPVHTVLWSGEASPGSAGTATIELGGVLSGYRRFEVTGYLDSAEHTFKLQGVYSPTGYYGAGLNASGTFYSTGGFFYHIAVYVSEDGVCTFNLRALNSSNTSFSSDVTITKIVGEKYTVR